MMMFFPPFQFRYGFLNVWELSNVTSELDLRSIDNIPLHNLKG